MKRLASFFSVLIFSLLLFNLAFAGKVDIPSYRAIPLKALDICIDSCGMPPNSEDLEGSYDYQMCVADCHPKIDFLHQSVDDLQGQINGLQAQIDALDTVQMLNELCNLYELTEKGPPAICLNCGDLYLQPLEECDDGNADSGDGCSEVCLEEVCGNGRIDYDEVCDDGNTDDEDSCNFDCSTEIRRVFVTSNLFNGNLGGLAGADAKCQEAAGNAGLTGTYKAWLSDSVAAAKDRLTHFNNGYYVLVDGTPVIDGWDDLVTFPFDLINSINIDENGNEVTTNVVSAVWTNTTQMGYLRHSNISYSCANWTSSTSYYGYYGVSVYNNYFWTNRGATASCRGTLRLYCFEQ